MADDFAFKLRGMSLWLEPDGMVAFSAWGNAFTWKDMIDTQPDSAWGQWVEYISKLGFNALEITTNADKHPQEMAAFSGYLKQNGIGMILRHNWNEIELGFSYPLITIERGKIHKRLSKFCPYSDKTRSWWKKRIEKDFSNMPGLTGYFMAGTETYSINGAPWMCDCSTCKTRTPRQRLIDGIKLVADLLKPYRGTLIYCDHQDDAESCRTETFYFRDLTGEIPDNSFLSIQRTYWDFHPGWPRHPLLETLKPDGISGASYMAQFQLPGEYRGASDFPWCMVEEWSDYFRHMKATGQQGLWVSIQGMRADIPGKWDHPFNMVNWYALHRFMLDPMADPAEIKLTWAEKEFGKESAPTVIKVIDKATEAARGALEFDALWTACHSRFPDLEYLDSHLCGSYRQVLRMEGMMGFVLPLDMYSPQLQAEIRAKRETRMVFNQEMITPELKAEAMVQKEESIRKMKEAISLWYSLKGKIEGDKYQNILEGLKGNLDDTTIFRNMMELYMDWKLGILTNTRIDSVLEESKDLKGILVPDPLTESPQLFQSFQPASLKTLAEELRSELTKPRLDKFLFDNSDVGTIHKPETIKEKDSIW